MTMKFTRAAISAVALFAVVDQEAGVSQIEALSLKRGVFGCLSKPKNLNLINGTTIIDGNGQKWKFQYTKDLQRLEGVSGKMRFGEWETSKIVPSDEKTEHLELEAWVAEYHNKSVNDLELLTIDLRSFKEADDETSYEEARNAATEAIAAHNNMLKGTISPKIPGRELFGPLSSMSVGIPLRIGNFSNDRHTGTISSKKEFYNRGTLQHEYYGKLSKDAYSFRTSQYVYEFTSEGKMFQPVEPVEVSWKRPTLHLQGKCEIFSMRGGSYNKHFKSSTIRNEAKWLSEDDWNTNWRDDYSYIMDVSLMNSKQFAKKQMKEILTDVYVRGAKYAIAWAPKSSRATAFNFPSTAFNFPFADEKIVEKLEISADELARQ